MQIAPQRCKGVPPIWYIVKFSNMSLEQEFGFNFICAEALVQSEKLENKAIRFVHNDGTVGKYAYLYFRGYFYICAICKGGYVILNKITNNSHTILYKNILGNICHFVKNGKYEIVKY